MLSQMRIMLHRKCMRSCQGWHNKDNYRGFNYLTPYQELPHTSLCNYRPKALSPIIIKCFKRVVLAHTLSLDPVQYAYWHNRSTSDTITLHYMRKLFVNYSSAYNIIIPKKLTHKLFTLCLHLSISECLLDFDWPLYVSELEVEMVSKFRCLGVHINEDLTWTFNTN